MIARLRCWLEIHRLVWVSAAPDHPAHWTLRCRDCSRKLCFTSEPYGRWARVEALT